MLSAITGCLAVALTGFSPQAQALSTAAPGEQAGSHSGGQVAAEITGAGFEPVGSYAGLYAVDALTSTDVWAVGRGNSEVGARTDHWDGVSWTTVDSPTVKEGRLEAVDAIAADDVWAVGDSYSKKAQRYSPLVEHWDGRSWTVVVVPPPDGGSRSGTLNGVSAASSDDVWAVGGSPDGAIAYHWNGARWRSADPPQQTASSLSAVVALSKKDVWAVGAADLDGYFVHWDGDDWTVVPGPAKGPHDALGYRGVAAAGPDDVWAVGGRRDEFYGRNYSLTAHWDGSAWTEVDSYSSPDRSSRLAAVDVVTTGEVWAVGSTGSDYGTQHRELAERWNGRKWSDTRTPKGDSVPRALLGISAVASDDVWSVGYGAVLHFDGVSWQSTR